MQAADYGLWWSNSFVFTKDQFLNRLISNFTKHELPFTHLVMDFGWHQRQNATNVGPDQRLWASYTWNKDLFGETADVQDFVQSLHSTAKSSPLGRSMALSLNLHPVGVQPVELRYQEFERQVHADPALNETLACTLSNETWMTALFDQVLDAEPNAGVDSWWTDGTCDGGTYGGSWENQFAFSERIAQHRELRGYVMSRWGGVGSQRSPMGFSGDQTTAWPTLQFQVESTPLASNVGFNSWSHDIGGFDCCGGAQGGIYGHCPFPKWEGCETNSSTDSGSQLLVRWLQHGALSAVDRTHCGGCNREFWTFPNFDSMKSAMNFRIALFPYLYSENHRTRTSGVGLLYPVYYESPELDNSYLVPSQYFFGPAILVQPIVLPIPAGQGALTVSTWLPPGEWSSWDGAKTYTSGAEAGTTVSASYSVHEVPMFVRAGAVVPMRTPSSLTQTVAFSDPLVWVVWPAGLVAGGNSTVVEDDGVTLGFERGATASTTMNWRRKSQDTPEELLASDDLVLSVAATTGSFDVGCSAEVGYEYAGSGADLQDVGVVDSHGACCDSCASYSNCAFWTWSTETTHCVLKVSRRGRRANSSAVSGLAPRKMPTTRAHVFQLRAPQFAAHPPSAVTVDGQSLPKLAASSTAGVGWFVQGKEATPSLTTVDGALVIRTASVPLTQRTIDVHVSFASALAPAIAIAIKSDDEPYYQVMQTNSDTAAMVDAAAEPVNHQGPRKDESEPWQNSTETEPQNSTAPPSFEESSAAQPPVFSSGNPSATASQPEEDGRRGLQGDGVSLCTARTFWSRSEAVSAECCNEAQEDCISGYPVVCNSDCAAILLPFVSECKFLFTGDTRAAFKAASQTCAEAHQAATTCAAELAALCDGARRSNMGSCWVCEGSHQQQLENTGCTSADLSTFCAVAPAAWLPPGPRLRDLAAARTPPLLFGSDLADECFGPGSQACEANGTYAALAAAEFNAGNDDFCLTWSASQPTPANVYDFTCADRIFKFMNKSGQIYAHINAVMAGAHNVEGDGMACCCPTWLTNGYPYSSWSWANGTHGKYNYTRADVRGFLQKRIQAVVPRWLRSGVEVRGIFPINEAIANQPYVGRGGWPHTWITGPEENIFSWAFGNATHNSTDWFAQTFKMVRAAADGAGSGPSKLRLFYNDYGIETPGAKTDAVYRWVTEQKAAGVPIDGVGMQAHLRCDCQDEYGAYTGCNDTEIVAANMKRFIDVGLAVWVTELDVTMQPGCTLDDQAAVYSALLGACLANAPHCDSFMTWGFTDKHTWLPGTAPLMFDEQYQPKPAYFALQKLLASGLAPAEVARLSQKSDDGNTAADFGARPDVADNRSLPLPRSKTDDATAAKKKIRLFLLPHTHADVGWLETPEDLARVNVVSHGTAAIPMDNSYCSCKLTRDRLRLHEVPHPGRCSGQPGQRHKEASPICLG